MKIKNDVSFLIDERSLSLFEHQSTFNPNMPLRGFLYTADIYRQLLKNTEDIYKQQLVKIPTPQYIVFYNDPASKMKEDVITMKLSDAFEDSSIACDFQWTAKVININKGHNDDLKQKCPSLFQYSFFL